MVLPIKARVWIAAATLAGIAVLICSAVNFHSVDPARFFAYLLLTAIAAGMKVCLPGVTGTMSVGYIFVLLSIVQLSFGEAVNIAAISALVQCFWRAKERPRLAHLLFNTSTVAVSAAIGHTVYHAWPQGTSIVFSVWSVGCAFFLSNTISIAGIIGITDCKPILQVWKTSYFWSFPYYLIGASLALCMNHLSRFFNWEISLAILPMIFLIYRSYRLYVRQLEEQKRNAEATTSLHLRTIEALALAIEAKDQTTGEHLKRVQIYSREIGKELGLTEEERRALEAASILHDVGKLAVPDYIISKPGKLTPEEFDKMKIHPVVGAEILERIDFPYPVVPIVLAHHEKWDGSGYPFGLREQQIPIGARILAAVDCLDALSSDRQYRTALSLDQAMNIVRAEAGKSFDPQVVEVLERRYLELECLTPSAPALASSKLSLNLKIERGDSPDAGFEDPLSNRCGRSDIEGLINLITNAHQHGKELYDLMTAARGTLSLTDSMELISARLQAVIPCDTVALYLLERGELVPRFVWGEDSSALASLRVPIGAGVAGWVAENKRPILNGNPAVEPGYASRSNHFDTLHSVLAVPLQGSRQLGVLALYKNEKDGFCRDHLRILLTINNKVSWMIQNSLPAPSTPVRSRSTLLTQDVE